MNHELVTRVLRRRNDLAELGESGGTSVVDGEGADGNLGFHRRVAEHLVLDAGLVEGETGETRFLERCNVGCRVGEELEIDRLDVEGDFESRE